MPTLEALLEKNYKKVLAQTRKRFDPDQNFRFTFTEAAGKECLLSVFKEEGDLLVKGKYLEMGFYDHRSSVWTWAWHSEMSKKSSKKIKKRFSSWVHYIEKEYGKKVAPLEGDKFLFYLREGSFHTSPSTLPLLVKLFLLVSKALWIFPMPQTRRGEKTFSTKGGKNSLFTEYVALSSLLQTF